MSQKDFVLRVEQLTKVFNQGKQNQVDVLKHLSISMQEGDFFALMGPSGSGKSTLLNIVGGLITPTDGKVYIRGKDIFSQSDSKLAEIRGREIGWIFQNFGLITNLTAKENVMIPLNLQGIIGDRAERRSEELLKRVGLGDRINHFPDDLSGGQQQRVAIARALANDPPLILADEPTGNLDTTTGIEIIELFKELSKEGKAILMVTHDVKLAHASDRVFLLRNGALVDEKEVGVVEI